jgi:hypothetical protein
MPKIVDLIEIKVGYANYVNLVDEFADPDRNRARMEGYMPISSHRVAFERLAHLCLPNDNRVYLLLGTYGTGKSHLLLMLANYLARAKHEIEMTLLKNNWTKQDADQAEKLMGWRGQGRYLVALADFGKGGSLESMVLRAIAAACAREEYDGLLRTHYGAAADQLRHWRQQQAQGGPAGALSDFSAKLEALYPATTLDGLIQGLERYDAEALEQFRRVYHDALGVAFQLDADNLVDILESFMAQAAFRERYRGLVILADEFGYVLDHGDLDISVFHRFSELCRNGVPGSTLAFIGTGHRASLQAYAGMGYAEADIAVLADRVEAVDLLSEGIEEIISAIVVPRRGSELWRELIQPESGTLNKLAIGCDAAGVFKGLPGPQRLKRIVEGIYPMHPMATHCAIELSTVVGSAARSLFTFFAGKANVLEEGSYPWFIETTEVKSSKGLNLYTADLLARYFHDELQPENLQTRKVVRDEVRNYQASLRVVQELALAQSLLAPDPLSLRVLDLVLVYRSVGLVPTRDNILFGLNLTTLNEETFLDNALKALCHAQALFLNPTTAAYEFRMAGAGRDIQQFVDAFLADDTLHPKDLAAAVLDTEALKGEELWLRAEGHNNPYSEDKRLQRVFALPGNLERAGYIAQLQEAMEAEMDWRKRYEGVAVYVLCESRSDIERARRVAAQNTSERVILGIPEDRMPMRQPLLSLLAALYVRGHENLDEWSEQERMRLNRDYVGDHSSGYLGAFLKARDGYLQGRGLCWIGVKGQVLTNRPSLPHEPASALMAQLYTLRNLVSHFDLNQIHVRFGAKLNAPLADAVNTLIRTSSPIVVDTSLAANTGDIRYLRNALANCDVLAQVGKASGSRITYRVQPDSTKYAQIYPALAAILDELRAMKPGDVLSVRGLLARYSQPRFGQGPHALSFFLAVAIRALGDSLLLKWSAEDWGNVTLSDASQLFELVDGGHPNAVFAYREITTSERAFINGVYRQFSEDPGPAGQDHSISEAYGALKHWWDEQTNLAKAASIYDESDATRPFVAKMAQIDSYTPHEFVLRELQTVYGLEASTAITDANRETLLQSLATSKEALPERTEGLKRGLIDQLAALFHPTSQVYGDYQAAIEAWYNGLQDYQKDPHAYAATQQQAPALLQHLPKIDSLEETFWQDLPGGVGFGLGKVDAWTLDRSEEYLGRFAQGLKAIAECRPPIPDPEWKVKGGKSRVLEQGLLRIVEYSAEVRLTVSVPRKAAQVFVTNNGQDPRQVAAQRESIDHDWERPIKETVAIRLVSRAADGEYGRVVEVQFRNQDLRYQVEPKLQSRLNEQEYYFTLAHDKSGVRMTLESLIVATLAGSAISKQELADLLRELAKGLSD